MAKKKVKTKASKPVENVVKKTQSSWWTNTKLHLVILGLLAFGLYINTLGHQYCQDDAIVITDNMYTTQGVKGIKGIFTKDTFYGFFQKDGKGNLVQGGRYRPLTLAIFALEWQVFGDSPFVFHLVNVLLYVFLGLVFYQLMVTLLAHYSPQQAKLTAFFAALIFVVHPTHTEVVANIKGADEIVALLGSLLAMYFMIKAYRTSRVLYTVLSAIIFGITIFSKENTITFLAIVPVALYLFGDKERSIGKALKYTIPLVLAVIPFLVVRGRVLPKESGIIETMKMSMEGGETPKILELMNNPFVKIVNNRYVSYSVSEKIATKMYTMGDYVRLLFVPHPLTSDYYPHHIKRMQMGDGWVILSFLVYLGFVFLAVKSWRKRPLISLGILAYLASLSIVSNFLFPVGTFMAERFLFMPSIGFSMVLGSLLYAFFRKGKETPTLAILGLIVLLFGVKTIGRNPAWKNDDSLFLTDIKVSKESAKIQNAVGGTLLKQAFKSKSPDEQLAKTKEAIEHLNLAIKAHPNYKNAWLLLGKAYHNIKQFDQAIQAFKNVNRVTPGVQAGSKELLRTLRTAGKYYGETKGDLKKAIGYLQQAEALSPNDLETNRLLGVAYAVSGQFAKAIPYMEKTFAQAPSANGALDLANVYFQVKNPQKASFYEQKALELDPDVVKKRKRK